MFAKIIFSSNLITISDVIDAHRFIHLNDQALHIFLGDATSRDHLLRVLQVFLEFFRQVFDDLVDKQLVAWQSLNRLKKKAVDAQSVTAFVLHVLWKKMSAPASYARSWKCNEIANDLEVHFQLELRSYLPESVVHVRIAQLFGPLAVDCVDNVTVEKVSRNKVCENLCDLFGVVVTAHQCRQKLVLVEVINRSNVGKNTVLLSTQRLRNILPIEDRHVVIDAGLEGTHVVLFILQKLANNVVKFWGNAASCKSDLSSFSRLKISFRNSFRRLIVASPIMEFFMAFWKGFRKSVSVKSCDACFCGVESCDQCFCGFVASSDALKISNFKRRMEQRSGKDKIEKKSKNYSILPETFSALKPIPIVQISIKEF